MKIGEVNLITQTKLYFILVLWSQKKNYSELDPQGNKK